MPDPFDLINDAFDTRPPNPFDDIDEALGGGDVDAFVRDRARRATVVHPDKWADEERRFVGDAAKRFPRYDPEKLREAFRMSAGRVYGDREMARAREKHKNTEEPVIDYIARRAIPYGSALIGRLEEKEYGDAQRRIADGKGSTADFDAVAKREQLQANASSSFGMKALDAAARIPAVVGEMGAAGKVAGAAGRLMPKVGIPALEVALGGAGNVAALTAGTPSMYLEDAQRRANEQGGEFYDAKNLAPAFALGAIQTAVLGRLGKNVGKADTAAGRLINSGGGVGRGTARLGIGLVESEVASAVAKGTGLQTKYGTLTELAKGDGDLADAATHILTFAAYTALHAKGDAEAKARARDAAMEDARLQIATLAGQGYSKERIGTKLKTDFGKLAEASQRSPDTRPPGIVPMDQPPRPPSAPPVNAPVATPEKVPAQPPTAWKMREVGRGTDNAGEYIVYESDQPGRPTFTVRVPPKSPGAAPTPEKVPAQSSTAPEIVAPERSGAAESAPEAPKPAPKAAEVDPTLETDAEYRAKLEGFVRKKGYDPEAIAKLVKDSEAESPQEWDAWAAENKVFFLDHSASMKYARQLSKEWGEKVEADASASRAEIEAAIRATAEAKRMRGEKKGSRIKELISDDGESKKSLLTKKDRAYLAQQEAKRAAAKPGEAPPPEAAPESAPRDIYDRVRADAKAETPIDALTAEIDASLAGKSKAQLVADAEAMEIVGTKNRSKEWIAQQIKQKIIDQRSSIQRGLMTEAAPLEAAPPVEAPGGLREKAARWESEAAAELKAKLGGDLAFSGFDPSLAAPLAKYIAAKIVKGGYTVADWTRDAVRQFGEGVKPHIDDIWARAHALTRGEEPTPPPAPPVEPPKPAAPAPTPGARIDPTSIKNATTDAERANRGMPPALEADPVGHSFPELREQVLDIAKVPGRADAMIQALEKDPSRASDLDAAVLLHRQVELSNEYDRIVNLLLPEARKDGKPVEIAFWENQLAVADAKLLQLFELDRATGRGSGRGLNARKMLMAKDFSLARMVARKRAKNGGRELNAGEMIDVKNAAAKIAELQAKLDAKESIQSRKAVEDLIGTETERAKRAPRQSATRKVLDDAWTDFTRKATGKLFSTPLDPELLASAANLAKALMKHGVASAQDFIAAVRSKTGKTLDDEGKRLLGEAWKSASAGQAKEKVDKALSRMKPNPSGGVVSRLARMLQREAVENGIEKLDAVVNHVHERLREALPDITLRETMDAISGSGQYRQLPKGELEAKLRDQRGQLQQLAKIDNMMQGEAPPKSGFEQREPSRKEKEIESIVEALKKKGGFVVTDPETQIKSALEAKKTRLENEIEDLEHQLKTGTKIVKGKAELVPDVEAEMLRQKRDALKEEFDAVFGDPGKTDAQRVQAAIEAAKRSTAEYERRVREGDWEPEKESKTPLTPELEAARAKRDAARAEFEELLALTDVGQAGAQKRALAAAKASIKRQIADYQERLANGDFTPRKAGTTAVDAEAKQLRVDLENVKRTYLKGLERDAWNQRTRVGKAMGYAGELLDLSVAIKTSFDISAVGRQGATLIGRPLIAAKAIPEMFKAFASKNAADLAADSLRERENFKNGLYKRAGLKFSLEEMSFREEAYVSWLADRIPGVAGSARAYKTYLNRVRADIFDSMASTHGRGQTLSEAEAKAIANYANVATGAGNFGEYAGAAQALARVFWSPSYVLSRFQYLGGQPLWGGTMRTRKAIATEYVRTGAGLAALYATARVFLAAFGEDGDGVELDPRSSDFGKIKIGRTRVDPLAGLQQVIVMGERLRTGQRKGQDGKVRETESNKVLADFARSKASVPAGAAWDAVDIMAGHDTPPGHPDTTAGLALGMVTPLAPKDIYESIREQGLPKGAALGLLALLGMGVQNQKPRGER